MKIAFIVNHYKTISFYELSKKLAKNNISTYWISPSKKWSQWLYKKGVLKNYVLDVTEYGIEWGNKKELNDDELKELMSIELYSNLRINNIIYMDRLLREKDKRYSQRFLYTSISKIDEFLNNHNIKFVFGEQTWAFEIVTAMTCKKHNVEFLYPKTIRIPDSRFVFFKGYDELAYVKHKIPDEADKKAIEYYKYFTNKRPKPSYFFVNQVVPKPKWDWPLDFFKNIITNYKFRYDETEAKLKWKLINRTLEVVNAFINRRFVKFESPRLPNKKPFILFTPHKQPEASVDVVGWKYSDQLKTIQMISKHLPINYELWVKEHSNAVGDRNFTFYKKLKAIHNVRLINPYASSFDFIDYAQLTVSITGTISMECALLGKKSTTLVPMFFDELMSDKCLNNIGSLCLGKGENPSKHEVVEKYTELFANSFEGVINHPLGNSEAISVENISRVERGFLKVIKDSVEIV